MRGFRLACIVAMLLAAHGWLSADTAIPVPNGSFEKPSTIFVATDFDSWQKTPKPDWFVEDPADNYLWKNEIGVFLNTGPTSSDHLDNIDGKQASYLFSIPDCGMFQDYDTVDYNDPAPTHAFDAVYEVGKIYLLTVGVCGHASSMPEGATMDISLYYRDAAGNRVPIHTAKVTHDYQIFPDHTHFVDFRVLVPAVKPTDPWAGKHIGIQFLSTVEEELEGGYWDLDNVRLSSVDAVPLFPLIAGRTTDNARVTCNSLPGFLYQFQSSDNLVDWQDEGAPVPGTGGPLIRDFLLTDHPRRFFRTIMTAVP